MPTQLKELQRLLYRLITAPSGAAEGLAAERGLGAGGLEAIVRGDDRLSAEARVDIYANMYFYRILDALKEDFPATLAVLGADNFHNLVTGYLLEYPPSEPSLYYCGRYLAEYLRAHPMREQTPFVADLAALERAIVEVFQGRDSEALAPDALRATAPADWPAMNLRLQPAAQILALDWRVSDLARAVEDKRPWQPPEHRAAKVLVWRIGPRVFHRELEAVEADALDSIARVESFAEICDRIAALDRDPVTAVNQLLARWLSDGLLAQG